ncbi:MAG: hypothetical protein ACYDH6_14205 [Acidimicrobiales bacterium]
MDRRKFLTLTFGGLVVGACGGGKGSTTSSSSSSAAQGNPDMVLVPNDWEYFAGGDYRMAILLANGKANGAPLPLDSPVTLRVGPENGPLGPPIPMVIHAKGPEPAYALTTYRFPKVGAYTLEATFKGKTASLPISVIDPSASATPVVGAMLPSLATPTVASAQGVNPVCTAQPPCPFHQVSLDAALAAKHQIALLFATPALCQSRFCGPVLGNLQSVAAPWASSVTFIHCEIYSDLSGQTLSKASQAYNLQHEPMLYLAGSDGTIKARVDNLFDQDEARSVLQAAFGPS